MSNFLDVKIGDIVLVNDEYGHDLNLHRVKVDSIEADHENVTETNPEGITYYGSDIDETDWGYDYITAVTEATFYAIAKEEDLQ